ncbi:dihydrofolate reductase family protein [Nocardia donostiensis]|uniref:Bacterial bifunctional deaminase-reductase C-terminal domain-containing protein n=1 Tax=Nocardia donostiensis TaxID=1538463 RepID=A0A1W0AYV0_9NOCA|nr:dihydrofolate reductase family protein [Nocardia donostiensis]ONM49704.1 hypothetical protein B0T46_04585 [Nocardia donostiensis]OQS15414.1 hypothetical protein B0T36_08990 [Nocardia donostiensis]OQS19797.1 hypothetical protein B0T44_12255 [Nocardia donostiensis]
MRELIVQMMVTVDGYAAGADGGLDWIEVDDPELDDYLAGLLGSVGGQIFGRTSYDLLAQYWPDAEHRPATPGDARLAPLVNGLPKIVVTTRREPELPWQPATSIGTDFAEQVARLKAAEGKPLVVFAGITTARAFLQLNAVDELRLLVFPLLLGAGQRLFEDGPRIPLHLIEARPFPTSGVVLQRYRH